MYIADTEPPQITCIDQSLSIDFATSVELQNPVATDNSADTPNVTCDALSGSVFVIGETTISCEAVDGSGNRAECSFIVQVTGDYKGVTFIYCESNTGLLYFKMKFRFWRKHWNTMIEGRFMGDRMLI